MRPISTSMDALLEDGIDETTTYVVIDTYKFSTTVTVALAGGIDTVHCEPTNSELEPYRNRDDFLAGGEVKNSTDDSIGNSPRLVRQHDENVDKIALTSENGAKRTYQLAENGAQNIILGCLRNADAVAEYLLETDAWTLVPADSFGAPRFEDYMAAVLITNLTNGLDATDRVFAQYQQRVNEATSFSSMKERRRKDWQLCSQTGVSTVIPKWDSAGYFA